jgi:diguanylate cyclase (GGDEF)-like protein
MKLPTPSLPPGEPDPKWLRRLLLVQRSALAVVLLISIAGFSAVAFPAVGVHLRMVPLHLNAPIALTVIFCDLSLWLSEPGNPILLIRISRFFAAVSTILATVILVISSIHLGAVHDSFVASAQAIFTAGTMSPLSAAAFLFLSYIIIVARTDSPTARLVADVLVSCLCLVALILVCQDMFGALGLFALTTADLISPQVLLSLVLLTAVITFRQAEFGVFSIFLGAGIGSRIARGFAPVLLAWPIVREIGEAQAVFRLLIPAHFAASVLTALAVAFSIALLLILVWRVNDMEKEIHDLTLRDDLTGLYNMRGFYLLGEQTLRLAQRAKMPFSVLFLDLDGLKKINDHLGHNVGSAYLQKTGEIILANFRDADVKGRFGGDEFVIAGQFSMVGIEVAALRLKTLATEMGSDVDPRYPLSFSIGHVTAEHYSTETLKELVIRADHEMYEDKRFKKTARV